MDEYLRFENATFSFKQLQFFEIFRSQPVFIAGAYFRGGGGGLIHRRSFPFQKLVPKRSGAYTRWDLLSELYGIFI